MKKTPEAFDSAAVKSVAVDLNTSADKANASFVAAGAALAETLPSVSAGKSGGMDVFTVAVDSFITAYNQLTALLIQDSQPLFRQTAEALLGAIYRPVALDRNASPGHCISLYEIGAAHGPNGRVAGRLGMDEKKFQAAMETRKSDICVLFTQAEDGLLARFVGIISRFLQQPESEPMREGCAAFLIQCGGLNDLFQLKNAKKPFISI